MSDKQTYRQLCEQEQVPLFMQAWWLDAVCIHKHWDVLLCRDEKGEVIAAMPYLLRKKAWLQYVLMPQHTQTGGVWLRKNLSSESQEEVVKKLVDKLKSLRLHYFYQQFGLDSPLPPLFSRHGFLIKERVTYRLEERDDIDEVIRHFSQNKRRQLNKSRQLVMRENVSAEEFYSFHRLCLSDRGRAIDYSEDFFHAIYAQATAHDAGQIVALQDNEGQLLAAAFVVWDDRQMYYLLPALRLHGGAEVGAGTRLVVECIRLAQERHITFDFEGSMTPSIANHYSQFGSRATTYYSVSKSYRPAFRLLLWANSWKEKWRYLSNHNGLSKTK